MFKTTTASLALLGSASASSAIGAKVDQKTAISYRNGLKAIAAQGTPSTQAQLDSAAAVSGDWYMNTIGSGRSCASSSNVESSGYHMGSCYENFNGAAASTWATYACTEDSSTGDVVLTETTYTDSACTAGATVQAGMTFSNTCSGSGKTSSCQDTNTYSADMASFSNGKNRTNNKGM